MKKVLVLMLVLGVASLANASYVISFNEAASTVTVSNDEAMLGGIDLGVAIIGSAPFGSLTLRTANAPASAPVVFTYTGEEAGFPEYTGGLMTFTWGDPVLTPNAAGDWFTMDVAGFVPGALVVLTDNTGVPLGGNLQSVVLTPEPATMLILGLGGLLLRKK